MENNNEDDKIQDVDKIPTSDLTVEDDSKNTELNDKIIKDGENSGKKGESPVFKGTLLPNDTDKLAYYKGLPNARKIAQAHEFNLGDDTVPISGSFEHRMFFVGKDSIENLEQKYGANIFAKEVLLEAAIKELRKKQILFITAPTMDWLEIAVSNIQTLKGEEWKDLGDALRVNQDKIDEISFGFWKSFGSAPKPTIVVLNDSNYDYIRGFMQAGLGIVSDYHKLKLRQSNLYLICQVPDSVEFRQLTAKYSIELKNQLAWWEVPVVQEEIFKFFGEGDGLEIFAQVKESGLMSFGQTEVYLAILDLLNPEENDDSNWTAPDKSNFTEKLTLQIKTRQNDLMPGLQRLKDRFKSGDQIHKALIFCAAFFPNITNKDFKKIVFDLLGDDLEKSQRNSGDEIIDFEIFNEKDPEIKKYLIAQKNIKLSPVKLTELLDEKFEDYLKVCELKLIKDGRRRKIQFALPNLRSAIKDYILDDTRYVYFEKMYERFKKAGMLYDNSMTESKLNALIKFVVTAAQNDEDDHNAEWLVDLILDIKQHLTVAIPEGLDFVSFLKLLEQDAHLKSVMNLLLSRITELVKEMLLTSDPEMKEMIKKFFRLLLNQQEAREIALKMALTLYRKLRDVPEFDEDLVLSYFKRVFDEGKPEQKVSAYNLLKNNFGYPLLYDITQKWIDDKNISEDSGTKRLSWYYCLEYCIYSMADFYENDKNGVINEGIQSNFAHGYSLFIEPSDEKFNNTIRPLIHCITSEKCIDAWKLVSVFGNELHLIVCLEYLITYEMPSDTRFDTAVPKEVTLLGDILDNYFFIMVKSWFKQERQPFNLNSTPPIQSRWKQFVTMVCEGMIPLEIADDKTELIQWISDAENNNLIHLLNYIDEKVEFHADISIRLNNHATFTKETIQRLDIIRSRYICSELLSNLLRSEIKTKI